MYKDWFLRFCKILERAVPAIEDFKPVNAE
jgi:hypothetical protein